MPTDALRTKLRANSVTRGASTSLTTSCRWQTFTPPLRALPPTEIIATAKDSWSRMVPPPPELRAREQEQAQALVQASALPRPPARMPPDGPLPQRASFSSQPASSEGSPAAASLEPDWARAAAQRLRPPPPDAPTRSAAGSRSAQASRITRYRAGPRADRAYDSSAPTRSLLPPQAVRTQWPATRPAEPTS